MPRYAARKDSNHAEITAVLEAHGIIVIDTSALGSGFPDVLCYDAAARRFLPIEFKSNNKISRQKKGDRLKPKQKLLHAAVPIPVAETAEQALALFGRGVH